MAKPVDLVRELLLARTAKADIGAVLDELWELFGGAKGFAQEAFDQYRACKDGSSAKLNMHRTLLEQMGEMQARHAKNAAVAPEFTNQEDMTAALQHILKQFHVEPTPVQTEHPAATDAGGTERPPDPIGTGVDS